MANYCTPNVQKAIMDLWNGQPWRSQSGTVDMAMSQVNGAAVQAQMVQQNGKASKYSITYPGDTCTTVVAVGDVACDDVPTATASTSCDTFDSFDGYSSEWHKITRAQMQDMGSLTNIQYIAHQIRNQMEKIKAKIDVAAIVAINSAAGCIADGTTTRTLKLVNPVTGQPYPHTLTGIENDFADAGYPVMPILLGNRQLNYLKNAAANGGVGDNGINNAGLASLPMFYDAGINATNAAPTTAPNETLFAINPGLVNILSWTENGGLFQSRNGEIDWSNIDPTTLINTDNSSYMHTVLADPNSGLLFDFDLVYDPRCKQFVWKIQSYYKIKVLSLTGCKDSCFTGIIKYDVCPWAEGSCDA